MRGIELKQHKILLKAIEKFEELTPLYGNTLPEGYEADISEKISELKGTYDYYEILLKELENCIAFYENKHESLRRRIYPTVRKMNSLHQSKN